MGNILTNLIRNLRKNDSHGFVLLFAIISVTIILTITMGILMVSLKQVILSTSSRDSHYAFFAADTGVECGLYYDQSTSAETNGSSVNLAKTSDPVSIDINCDESVSVASAAPDDNGDNGIIYNFTRSDKTVGALEVSVDGDNGTTRNYCAKLIITKHLKNGDYTDLGHPEITALETHIDSYGYNVSCDDLALDSNRAIERHLSAIYQENIPK